MAVEVEYDANRACKHCWHLSMMYLVWPPRARYRCCWCGAFKEDTYVLEGGDHGPYAINPDNFPDAEQLGTALTEAIGNAIKFAFLAPEEIGLSEAEVKVFKESEEHRIAFMRDALLKHYGVKT